MINFKYVTAYRCFDIYKTGEYYTALNEEDEITGDTIADIKLSIDEYIESYKMPLESI